jgi:serine/threonine protein kinase
MPLTTGAILGPYHILGQIGGGGMGVVYRAEDPRLRRQVAIKLLLPELTRDENARQRFLQEARAASALDHANICTIYEVGQTSDDEFYLVMAYYEGETLTQKIARGPLAVADATNVATQVARGLSKAHHAGIVHRDIKPGNLMVTTDGTVKILDFGLAKLAGSEALTMPAIVLGTVAYMSPEQALGERLDHRTDLWALGVVMYEMLAGKLPFRAESTQAVLYAIANRSPEPLMTVRPDVPMGIRRVVQRALERSPADRYQSADEMLADLGTPISTATRTKSGTTGQERAVPSIAVLPFVDMSPQRDQEYFCEGMAEELINALSALKHLRVAARSSSFKFKGQAVDATEIGAQLKVRSILEGSVRKAGNRLRITAQLIDTAGGFHLWSERYDRSIDDVFAVQDEIARAIVDKLKVNLLSGAAAPLVRQATEDVDAYNAYLKGRYYWNRRHAGGFQKAMQSFQEAIDKDPEFALPFSGLADSWNILAFYGYVPPTVGFPKAKAAAQKALALDDGLAEAHTSLAWATTFFDWDWRTGEGEFLRALQLNPDYGTAHLWYAFFLSAMGRSNEGREELRRALHAEPLSMMTNAAASFFMYLHRDFDRGIEEAQRALELDASFGAAHAFLANNYAMKGRFDEALQACRTASDLLEHLPNIEAWAGYCHAKAGNEAKAVEILAHLSDPTAPRYVSPYHLAMISLGLGRRDDAIEWLNRAYENRDNWMVYLNIDPMFDELRSDPRYSTLLMKIGLVGS